MTQEALKLALEALEVATTPLAKDRQEVLRAITAIKEALAQKQEPIAMLFGSLPVYDHTTPPQRTWVGLTDEELADCMDMSIQKTCRAIEAKLKQKNGYAEEKNT